MVFLLGAYSSSPQQAVFTYHSFAKKSYCIPLALAYLFFTNVANGSGISKLVNISNTLRWDTGHAKGYPRVSYPTVGWIYKESFFIFYTLTAYVAFSYCVCCHVSIISVYGIQVKRKNRSFKVRRNRGYQTFYALKGH